jgi:peptidyl-prolyl cis-trans isomerase D
MFEYIRTHQRLMQIILAVLIVPSFLLVGNGVRNLSMGHDDAIAVVDGKPVSQQEFDQAVRAKIDARRRAAGPQFDPKELDTPQERQGILDELLAQRALRAEMDHEHMSISDADLVSFYTSRLRGPDGKLDLVQYKAAAAAQGLTTQGLDQKIREQLLLQQLGGGLQESAIAPRAVTGHFADLFEEQRDVQELLFPLADYVGQVKVTDAMVKAYYDAHKKMFEVPESARIEYVVFDPAAVEDQVSVTDAEVEQFYKANLEKMFSQGEQRHASHILISVPKDATPAQKAAAKAKAEAILAEVKKNPGDFAKLAKANSQDPGSAAQGGDLGVIKKGDLVASVEQAIFALKQGEISNLVESEYGYHIITLPQIDPPKVRTLAEARPEIEAQLKQEKTQKKYAEMRESFGTMVYEQPDSLKPVADKLHLKIQTADSVTRNPNPALGQTPINAPAFLKALFSDDVVKSKHNTDAIDVGNSTMVAGRVVDYKPAAVRPLAEVEAMVRQSVTQEEAARLARAAGEARLAALRKADDTTGFGPVKTVSRASLQPAIPMPAAKAVLGADAAKLPALVGVELPGQGYGVYRIVKVYQPEKPDEARRAAASNQIGEVAGQEEMYLYIKALKQKAKAKINHPPVASAPAEPQ